MKKITLLSIFCLVAVSSWCQVSTLSQNFDVACVLSTGFPGGWLNHNSPYAPDPAGFWTCSPLHGRAATPGIECTGTYGSAYHLDTSYLITPELNLAGYSGNVYIQFDTKTSPIYINGDLGVKAITDTSHPETGSTDLTSGLTPLFTNGDSTGWVTHVANLTSFKASPFYIAFRYTSTATSGTVWYLDNVSIDTYNVTLNVPVQNTNKVSLSVLGLSSTNEIDCSYSVPSSGRYQLGIFDMVGREVYHEQLIAQSGAANHKIFNLDLHPGMYLLKMENEHSFGITKVMVR